MSKQQPTNTENEASLRLEYMIAAAWFWVRAEERDETLVSALNRTKARNLQRRFEVLHMTLPTPEEVYEYAQDRWPAHKLHPLK